MPSPKNSGYFLPLVSLPTLITGPGSYLTRNGATVIVEAVSARHDLRCFGHYENGVKDGWHKSGRILATSETANDIVSAVMASAF